MKEFNEEEKNYVSNIIEEINNETNQVDLSNDMDEYIMKIAYSSKIGEGENAINLEGDVNKIMFFSVILDGINKLEDKVMFYNKIINSNELNDDIIKYFEENKDKFIIDEKEVDNEVAIDADKEPEEEKEVSEKTESSITDNSENPVSNEEEKTDSKEEKNLDEKITKYIEDTEIMKQELEKMISDLNKNKDDEYFQKMEIYNKRIKECEQSIKDNNEKKHYKEETIKTLNEQLENSNIKINPWKFSEIYKNEIDNIEIIQQELSGKSFGEMSLDMYGLKEKINNHVNLMKQNYGRASGKLNSQDFIELIEHIKVGRQLKYQYENSISKTDDVIEKEIEEIITNISYTDKDTILNIMSLSDKIKNAELELEKITKEIENKTEEKERYIKLQKEYEEFTNNIEIENSGLKELIEKTKKDIEERENNIKIYKEIDKEIKELNGKNPEDEEIKKKVEDIKNKINTITDKDLRDELTAKLNNALGLNNDPEKKEPTPEKPGPVKKDPKKWHKWMGALGLALGGTAAALIPGGFLGALAISAGAELINVGYTAYKIHKKRKAEKELEPENEITNISRIEKVKQEYERIKKDIKELNENDKWFKNITWLLHGTAIGSLAVGTAELINGGDFIKFGGNETVSIDPTQTDPYSNVKIGESANGLDLTKGYDQANWASQNINAESLNQAIMQDGNSIIDSVRVTKDGVTHVVDTAGKSLSEVAQQLGVNPEDLVMNITNKEGAARAWVDAGEAIVRGGLR